MNHFDSITHSGTPGISDFSSWMVNSQKWGLLNSQISHGEDPPSGSLSIKSPDCGSSHSSQCRVVSFLKINNNKSGVKQDLVYIFFHYYILAFPGQYFHQ